MVFRADISRPQWRRDSLDGLLDDHVVGSAMRTTRGWSSSANGRWAKSCSSMARPTPSKARTSSRPRGASMSGRSGPMASSPGKRWETPNPGTAPTSCRSFIQHEARGPPLRQPIPSIRLKAYRRGQQDVEYLTLWSQLQNEPRWAVGQQVRATLKLAGTRRDGFAGGEDAGRIDYGRLRPRDLWALLRGDRRSPVQGPSGTSEANSSTSARPAASRSDIRRCLSAPKQAVEPSVPRLVRLPAKNRAASNVGNCGGVHSWHEPVRGQHAHSRGGGADEVRGESRPAVHRSRSALDRLSLGELMILIAGGAVGLGLLPLGVASHLPAFGPNGVSLQGVVVACYGTLSGITMAAMILLLVDRLKLRRPWGPAAVSLFVAGFTSWLFLPIVAFSWIQASGAFEPFSLLLRLHPGA